MKPLRPSVMRASEWWKREQRDQTTWKATRLAVLERDQYACVYCGFRARKFMQVNHTGAEDNHAIDNLETVCPPCHDTLHLGVGGMNGALSVISSLADQAEIVRATRRLVWKNQPWPAIESAILSQFLTSGGKVYTQSESMALANHMLHSIPAQQYRGFLPDGLAVVFHEQGPWNDFPERVHRWGYMERHITR